MLINSGTQERFISEVTVGAGTTVADGSINSDSLFATLWVNSISGTLTVQCFTLTEPGKEELLFTFPVVSAGTTDLLSKKAGISLQRFRIVATYTGVCDYEVYVRAIAGIGEASTKIVGANTWSATQISVPTTATLLIPSSLLDRAGLIIRNWNTSGVLYVAESALAAAAATAYPIAALESLAIDLAAGAEVYGIADTGTIDTRIAQAGG